MLTVKAITLPSDTYLIAEQDDHPELKKGCGWARRLHLDGESSYVMRVDGRKITSRKFLTKTGGTFIGSSEVLESANGAPNDILFVADESGAFLIYNDDGSVELIGRDGDRKLKLSKES